MMQDIHTIVIIRHDRNILLDYDNENNRYYVYEFFNRENQFIENLFNKRYNLNIELDKAKKIIDNNYIYYDIIIDSKEKTLISTFININKLYIHKIKNYMINNIKRHIFDDTKKIGGIIYDTIHHKFLLVKGTMKWSFPKGHYDYAIDKNDFECAKREIYEETSLSLNIDIKTPYKILSNNKYYITILPNGSLKELKTLDSNEILDIKWFSIDEIKKMTDLNSSVIKICENRHYHDILNYILSLLYSSKNNCCDDDKVLSTLIKSIENTYIM